jgi:hypothetical protein
MAITYPVKLCVELLPVAEPWVKIRTAGKEITVQLTSVQQFEFDINVDCPTTLAVELFGKSDLDPEQAVKITKLSFYGISDPRFIWRGEYRPCYPDLWAKQQQDQGIELLPVLTNTDYLGWNGTWCLKFDVPIFTWIHQVQDLGWIYS